MSLWKTTYLCNFFTHFWCVTRSLEKFPRTIVLSPRSSNATKRPTHTRAKAHTYKIIVSLISIVLIFRLRSQIQYESDSQLCILLCLSIAHIVYHAIITFRRHPRFCHSDWFFIWYVVMLWLCAENFGAPVVTAMHLCKSTVFAWMKMCKCESGVVSGTDAYAYDVSCSWW